MDTVTIQVPMQTSLKYAAAKVAQEYGFSSLQEVIRVLLNQFTQKKLVLQFGPGSDFKPVDIPSKNSSEIMSALKDEGVYSDDFLQDLEDGLDSKLSQ